MIVEQILLPSTLGNVWRTVWRICILILGCNGLKTSGNQFCICRVLLEYYNCGECKCLVNIGLWSSILPPWRVPCVHKNWSWVPLPAFFGNKDQQRTTATPKNIFHERHLYSGKVHTTDMFEWSMSSIKVWLSVWFSFLANSLFLPASKTSVSLLSKKSISNEYLNIKDISYQQQVFPLFHNIRFLSNFFFTFESIRNL